MVSRPLLHTQGPDQSRPSLKGCLLLVHLDYVSIQIAISAPRAMAQIFRVHGACPLIRRKDASGAGRAPHDHSPGELRTRERMCVCITTYLRNLLHLHSAVRPSVRGNALPRYTQTHPHAVLSIAHVTWIRGLPGYTLSSPFSFAFRCS